MLCYRDRTFCSAECGNKDCNRHKCHVPSKTELPVSWTDFSSDCDMYRATCGGCQHDKDTCTGRSMGV